MKNINNEDICILAGKRSAFGRYLGTLSEMDPLELATEIGKAAINQVKGNDNLPVEFDHLFVGNCIPTIFTSPSTVGRQIGLALGLNCFAVTIDTACCSPLTGLRMAFWAIRANEISSAMLIGIDMMSKTPHLLSGLRSGVRAGGATVVDPIYPIEYKGYNPVSVDASNGAEKFGISRTMLDEWALGSQQKWFRANRAGFFKNEIVPLTLNTKRGSITFSADEFPKSDATLNKLLGLPPVFGSKTTTAGNAPGLNDGCSAVIIASGAVVKKSGLIPMGKIIACEGVTEKPDGISWVPATAIQKVLKKVNLEIEDMNVIEINEAFAAMPLVSTKILSDGSEDRWLKLLEKTNPNGGAIAIGHPVGASGLRILMTMTYELLRRGGGRGVCAICGGLSQGEAVIVEV